MSILYRKLKFCFLSLFQSWWTLPCWFWTPLHYQDHDFTTCPIFPFHYGRNGHWFANQYVLIFGTFLGCLCSQICNGFLFGIDLGQNKNQQFSFYDFDGNFLTCLSIWHADWNDFVGRQCNGYSCVTGKQQLCSKNLVLRNVGWPGQIIFLLNVY